MKFNDDLIKSFECCKCFKENTDKVNSINFSLNGELLISSSSDDSLNVYDVLNGKHLQTIFTKKYGCELARFTHTPTAVLHASNKYDDNIRYLSLHDNKYLRFFPGHTKRVISLMMSPKNDCFLSGSVDKTIRLWDLRSPNCEAIMNLSGRGLASIDPEGLIFCACVNNDTCKLYDLRTYEQGPFLTFTIPNSLTYDTSGNLKYELQNVRFSPDGKMILLTANGTNLALVDSFTGKLMQQYQILGTNPSQLPIHACFSPDSRYVMAGCPEGRVYTWRTNSPTRISFLQSNEGGTPSNNIQMLRSSTSNSGTQSNPLNVGALESNPLYALSAMGQLQTTLWMPNTLDNSHVDVSID